MADAAPPTVLLGAHHARNERRTWLVTAVCLATLVAQLAGGALFHSLALSAAGLHMAAHVAVLLTAAGAYALGRRWAGDPRFAFGAGKLGYLAGFANGVVLAITAATIAVESFRRLFEPQAVDYASAIPLAAAGLGVTLACIWLLRPAPGAQPHHHPDGDLNLSAAHLHLTADAVSSAFTLAALWLGARLGWSWADPLAGLFGAAVVAQFSFGLLRRAGAALLDLQASPELTAEIRRGIEAQGAELVDLRVWRVAPGRNAAIAVVHADSPAAVERLRTRLAGLDGLAHLSLEARTRAPPALAEFER